MSPPSVLRIAPCRAIGRRAERKPERPCTVDQVGRSALAEIGKFTIRVGAYPEKHPEASSLAADIDWLEAKLDALERRLRGLRAPSAARATAEP